MKKHVLKKSIYCHNCVAEVLIFKQKEIISRKILFQFYQKGYVDRTIVTQVLRKILPKFQDFLMYEIDMLIAICKFLLAYSIRYISK